MSKSQQWTDWIAQNGGSDTMWGILNGLKETELELEKLRGMLTTAAETLIENRKLRIDLDKAKAKHLWHPITEPPDSDRYVLVQTEDGRVTKAIYQAKHLLASIPGWWLQTDSKMFSHADAVSDGFRPEEWAEMPGHAE